MTSLPVTPFEQRAPLAQNETTTDNENRMNRKYGLSTTCIHLEPRTDCDDVWFYYSVAVKFLDSATSDLLEKVKVTP